jgi:hypothetical protein
MTLKIGGLLKNKYTFDSVPCVPSPVVHSIFNNNESEDNNVRYVVIGEDGYKVIPKPSFEEQVHSNR